METTRGLCDLQTEEEGSGGWSGSYQIGGGIQPEPAHRGAIAVSRTKECTVSGAATT